MAAEQGTSVVIRRILNNPVKFHLLHAFKGGFKLVLVRGFIGNKILCSAFPA